MLKKNISIMKISGLAVVLLIVGATNLFAGEFRGMKNYWTNQSNSQMWTSYFSDTLDVGESKEKTIRANEPWNYTNIKLQAGKRYKFTVGSPEWNNGMKETTAAGYNSDAPYASARRYTEYKMMALVGEIFNSNNNPATFTQKKFLIGAGRASYTAEATGYLVAFANDCLACYVDNSRVVTLTVKRIE